MVASQPRSSAGSARATLVLTGPPAAGKSTTGRLVAQARPSCAFIEVDDLRHLIVSGHRAPWEADGGPEQQLLGVRNACALVRAFAASSFESVVADMVAPETVHLYRRLDTGAVIVALRLSFEEAQRRASTRVRHITDAEFHSLYVLATATSGLADVVLDVDSLDISAQVRLIERVWAMHGATITPRISEGE